MSFPEDTNVPCQWPVQFVAPQMAGFFELCGVDLYHFAGQFIDLFFVMLNLQFITYLRLVPNVPIKRISISTK